MTFDFVSLFLVAFPLLIVLSLAVLRWIDELRARRRFRRAWAAEPGREVVRRRGGWFWRTAA